MGNDLGWIKLYRNSFNNRMYFSEPFTRWQAWVDLLLLANHESGSYFIRGIEVFVNRGEVGYGNRELAKRWRWSRGKVEKYLSFLEGKQNSQIVRKKTNVTTLISIVNYNYYQKKEPQTEPQTDPQTEPQNGHRMTTEWPQNDLNKNDKNNKNDYGW